MHRIDGDGYVEIGGKRMFVDQDDDPPIVGTIDWSPWNNAMQEEICNTIEALGGAIHLSSVLDTASGWHDLENALLTGTWITDTAVNAITFSKLSGEINLGLAATGTWVQNVNGLTYSITTAGIVYNAAIDPSNIKLEKTDGVNSLGEIHIQSSSTDIKLGLLDANNNTIILSGNGICYDSIGGPGTALIKNSYVFKASFDCISASWAASGNDGIFVDTAIHAIDIPATLSTGCVFSAFISWISGTYTYCVPARIQYLHATQQVTNIRVLNSVAPPDSFTLILDFDGTSLS